MTVSEQLCTYPSLNNHNINLNLSSVDYCMAGNLVLTTVLKT